MLGMLKKHTVELSPEVSGRLTNKGLPIKNKIIERSLTYADEEYIDSCETDSNGEFSFSVKTIKSRLPGNVLHEPIVRQAIYIDFEDKNYLLWHAFQDGIEVIIEFQPKLKNLIADISTPEKDFRITSQSNNKSYKIFSICNW
jgi:hypothetical protein